MQLADISKSPLATPLPSGLTESSDILYDLANVGDLPLPNTPPPAGHKRSRSPEREPCQTDEPESTKRNRQIAGSKRLQAYQQAQWPTSSVSPADSASPIPSAPPPSASASAADRIFALAGLPPLRPSSGAWPSHSTVSQMYPDLIQQASFSAVSSPGSAFEYDLTDASLQAILSSGAGPSYIAAMPPASYSPHAAPAGAAVNAPMQPNMQQQAAQPGYVAGNGMLDSEILTMWSLAPPGFE